MFRKGDYEKDRYYYVGGFGKFITDIIGEIEKLGGLLICDQEIISINENKGQNENTNIIELEILDKKTNTKQK